MKADFTEQQIDDIVAVFEKHATRWSKIIIAFAIIAMLGLYYLPR